MMQLIELTCHDRLHVERSINEYEQMEDTTTCSMKKHIICHRRTEGLASHDRQHLVLLVLSHGRKRRPSLIIPSNYHIFCFHLLGLLIAAICSIHCDDIHPSSSYLSYIGTHNSYDANIGPYIDSNEGDSLGGGALSPAGILKGDSRHQYLGQSTIPFYSATNDELNYKYSDDTVLEEQQQNNNNNSANAALAAPQKPTDDFKQREAAAAAAALAAHNQTRESSLTPPPPPPQISAVNLKASRQTENDNNKSSSQHDDGQDLQKLAHIESRHKRQQVAKNQQRITNRIGEFVNLDYDFGFDVNSNNNGQQPAPAPPNASSDNVINFISAATTSTSAAAKANNDEIHSHTHEDNFVPLTAALASQQPRRLQPRQSINGRQLSPPPTSSSSSLMMADLDQAHPNDQLAVASAAAGLDERELTNLHNDHHKPPWSSRAGSGRQQFNWSNTLDGAQKSTMDDDYADDNKRPSGATRAPKSTGLVVTSQLGEELQTAGSGNKIISGDWSEVSASSTRKPDASASAQQLGQASNSTTAHLRQANTSTGEPWHQSVASKFSKLLSSGGGGGVLTNETISQAGRMKAATISLMLRDSSSTLAPAAKTSKGGSNLNIAPIIRPRAPVYAAKARYTSSIVMNSLGGVKGAGSAQNNSPAASQLKPLVLRETQAGGAHSTVGPNRASSRAPPGDSGDESSSLKMFANQFRYTKPGKPSSARKTGQRTFGGDKRKKLSRVTSSGHHPFQRMDELAEDSSQDYNEDLADVRHDDNEDLSSSTIAQLKSVTLTTGSLAGKRSARTVANRTATLQIVNEPSRQQANQKNTGAPRRVFYDLNDERASAGASTSEYQTNYSSTLAQLAKPSFANSMRLVVDAAKNAKRFSPDDASSANVTSTNQVRDQTRDQTNKTSTKRRDTWDRMRALTSTSSEQRRLIPAPLIRLALESAPSTLVMAGANKMQPAAQGAGSTNSHLHQPNHNASQAQAQFPLPLPLPLSNYIDQQQVAASLASSDDRMSIVRSGFLVPSTFGSPSTSGPVPIHSLRALALLAHGHHQDSVGPAKQLRALSQLRALLSHHNHHHHHHHAPVGTPVISRPQPQQAVESLLQARVNLAPGNLTGGRSLLVPAMEQMVVATSNQLGVSHLAASEPSASYNALAGMQEYHRPPPPPLIASGDNGRGAADHSDQMGVRDSQSARPPPPRDSLNESEDVNARSPGPGPGPAGHHREEQDQHRGRGGGGGGNNGGTYNGDPARNTATDDYSQTQGSGVRSQQDGSYPYGYDSGRTGTNSSSGEINYYANLPTLPVGGLTLDPYGALGKHKSDIGNSDVDGGPPSTSLAMQNSLRSSLDTYEDYISSPQSTTDYVQDLADLDDEFNRHAIFSARPHVASSGAGRASSVSRDEYGTGPAMMSDSEISYSPQRYQSLRYHRYHRPGGTQPDSGGGASGGGGGGGGAGGGAGYSDYLSAAGSMANIIPRAYAADGGYHHHHHHHHNPTGGGDARQHNHHHHHQSHSSGGGYTSAAHDLPDGIWLTDSGTSYDPSPLASYFSPGAQYSTSGATYASWRAPTTSHHARYQHGAHNVASTEHQYSLHTPHHAQAHARATPYSPYFTLASAPSSYAPSTATSGTDAPQFGFIPAGYVASSAGTHHLASPVTTPTETVSFTLSPLAAAAAAAATALAAADKTRHHHHNHHAWTFTLPRLASTLAAQAVAPQLATAAATTGVAPTQMAATGVSPHGTSATLFQPQATYGATYHRPTSAAGANSYLFSPVPIYAIAPRPHVSGAPLTSAASGSAASILPAFHAFSHTSTAAAAGTPTIIAYRPASMFSSAPLLTSFAYPLRLGPLSPLGSSGYQPLGLTPTLGAQHSVPGGHHYQHSRPSSHNGRGAGSSSSMKPSIADLQWAESGSKSKMNNNNNNNSNSNSNSNSNQNSESLPFGLKNNNSFVKTTAGGLTQMARNLTKKMFGSASQVRPQFIAPPANFGMRQMPAAPSPITVALRPAAASISSHFAADTAAHYSPSPLAMGPSQPAAAASR